jgi:hypothetical protein
MFFEHSLEEFTGLMQGQSWVRESEAQMQETFAVFGTMTVGLKQLSLIVQVH